MKTVFVLLLLLSSVAWGQYKLGDLEIPKKQAGAYFRDLYDHPDTVWNSMFGALHRTAPPHTIGYVDIHPWPDSVEIMRDSVYRFIRGYWLVPREASKEDFIRWRLKSRYAETRANH